MLDNLTIFISRLGHWRYLGLHLTAGVLLLIGASWLLGGIADDVMTGDPLTVIDRNVSEWFHEHRTPGLTAVMQITTNFASFPWVTCVAAISAWVLWLKKAWYRLLALALVIPGGMALVPLLKAAFHRHRPSFADAFLIFDGYSFPSGHTMAATLLYGLLAYFVVRSSTAWNRRVQAFLGAFIMILLIGLSRVYLDAHYLSDVLAAGAAGLAWLAFSLTAVDILRRSRNRDGSVITTETCRQSGAETEIT